MPRYRATLAYNVRAYRIAEFEAANDAEAHDKALAQEEWQPLDPDNNDFDEADVSDRVLILDEVSVDGSHQRDVDDEIRVPAEMPYGGAARRLVGELAMLQLDTSEIDPRLRTFIERARALCGSNDAEVVNG